ncbi:hypothetical protein NE237_019167 [Protea cynaroides]|uniref:TFIIS N-terminal domain-containing protein n=1 Tax=Protea cynaroides TaxID=273540 RepID=A0A9Q0QPQ6_9MAGN|nr:hypothetical protein NE237_019167 [Protea cynaroides]
MKLEDFFTLTEMKDGLTALARVDELVSVMQKEKDSVLKNVREAARQWSTVARTLATTESKDCLDLFVRLDGLRFLDHWLQEVHKCSDEISDSFAEESITSLLAALEKLPKDNERLISSGINMTVKDLFVHKSIRVQDKARALFDGLNQVRDEDVDHQDIENGRACVEDEVTASAKGTAENGFPEQSDAGVSPSMGSAEEDKHLIEPSGGEFQRSHSSDGSHSRSVQDAKLHMSTNQHTSIIPLNQADLDGFRGYALEGESIVEESSLHPAEKTASTGTFSSLDLLKGNAEGKSSDILELKDSTEDGKETDGVKGSQDKSSSQETDSVPTSLGPICISSTANHLQSVMEPAAEETMVSEVKGVSVDDGLLKHSGSTEDLMNTDQDDECLSNDLQDLPSDKHNLRRSESLETSFFRVEVGAVSNVKDLSVDSISRVCRRGELAIPSDVLKLKRDAKASSKIEKKQSEMELEYGVDDALEVARQVAKEVEREVVDNREPFCSSSSEKNSEGGVVQPCSPDSINDEKDQLMTRSLHDVPTDQNLSCGTSSLKEEEENLTSSKDVDSKPENRVQDLESSQVTEAALEPADNSERGVCGFDLNEEVCSEEMASPPTPNSAPIAVSTTKAAAATAIPASPLRFEGALGWKGSAKTSAFRPPAPRKTPDGEKTLSIEGSSHSSRYRQDVLDFDLNVAGADDDVTDAALAKQIPESSSLPSGESSVEVSSRRAERLKLDLNRSGDNDDAPLSDSRTEGHFLYHHRNGHRSPSPASSSSSRRPPVRNIDLNDSPYLFDDTFDQRRLGKSPCQDMNAHGGFKVDDHFISIMGKRVEVNLKDCAPQTHSFIPNGQVGESLMDAGMARSGGGVVASPAIPHTASSSRLFAYGGLTTGSSLSVTPAVYGPNNIPYMVDSRGAPVLLQIMGSAAADPPSYSRGSFYTSMPSGLNGVGPSQSGFDLNSSLMMVEGSESREAAGLRQLFVQGQGGSLEEQMRTASLPFHSGVGIRRREPDSGWESYPVGYKRQAPWN